jgi:hypothetical protein
MPSCAESALHTSCRSGSLAAVNAVLDQCEDVRRAVNAKTPTGVTPLMLAAAAGGGHGSERASEAAAVARLLLQHGALAHMHNKSRRSAADYAIEHGKPRLAAELRRLAAEQLEASASAGATRSAAHGDAAHCPGETCARCAHCGDRLGGCKFRAAHDAVRRGTQRNALITQFFVETPANALATLSLPALHCVNNRRSFTRELTEALALLARLRRLTTRVDGAAGVGPRSWHVIDLCCGKAFFATLVGVLHADFLVTAVDKQPPTFVPHFEHAGLSAVTYVQSDVLAPGWVEQVAALVDDNGGRPVAVRAPWLAQATDPHTMACPVHGPPRHGVPRAH